MWKNIAITMRLYCPEDWTDEAFEAHVRSLIYTDRLMRQEEESIRIVGVIYGISAAVSHPDGILRGEVQR